MAGAKMVFDDSEVVAKLRQMRDLDQRSLLEEIGSYMVSSITRRFVESRGPDGRPWEALALSTIISRLGGLKKIYTKKGKLRKPAARKQAGIKPLVDRGHLRDSITYNVSGDRVAIGTNLIYGAIHHFGGQTGRNKAATIPARPYLGTSATDKQEIREITNSYVTGVVMR